VTACSRLALQVHALVSQAGFLGFSELSRRCSALEEACHAPADIVPAFEAARVSARAARRMITTLQ